MKRLGALVLLAAASCAPRVPEPEVVGLDPVAQKACTTPALPPAFRAIHTLIFTLPGRGSGSFIGVTVADVPSDRLRSTLLSVEGLVLFDAVWDKGGPTVFRALPPLDTEGFAQGLFSDVRLLFFPPEGRLEAAGRDKAGVLVCRWMENESTVEKTTASDMGMTVQEYTEGGRLLRGAVLSPPLSGGFHKKIDLTAYGTAGYSVSMGLVEEEPVRAADEMFAP